MGPLPAVDRGPLRHQPDQGCRRRALHHGLRRRDRPRPPRGRLVAAARGGERPALPARRAGPAGRPGLTRAAARRRRPSSVSDREGRRRVRGQPWRRNGPRSLPGSWSCSGSGSGGVAAWRRAASAAASLRTTSSAWQSLHRDRSPAFQAGLLPALLGELPSAPLAHRPLCLPPRPAPPAWTRPRPRTRRTPVFVTA